MVLFNTGDFPGNPRGQVIALETGDGESEEKLKNQRITSFFEAVRLLLYSIK